MLSGLGWFKASFVPRLVGIVVSIVFGYWSSVLTGSRLAWVSLDDQAQSVREAVKTASNGLVEPDEPVSLGAIFADIGAAFGVLLGVVAIVVFAVSIFP